MAKVLRAGVIGAGFISVRGHIPAYRLADGVEVVALCDLNEGRAKQVAEEQSISQVYTDYREMLAQESLDLVSVCSPNVFHAPMTLAAMEAGAHVVCEKPMALTHAEAKAMVETSERTGRSLTVAHHMRYQPEAIKAAEMLKAGQLGTVYYAKASYLRRNGIPGYGSWFTRKELAGGGALMDIGCHMLDLSLSLLGNPRPLAVSAMTYAEFGPRAKGLGTWGADHFGAGAQFDVDDLATAFVRLEGGITLVLEASWATHGTQGQMLQLFGTEGGIELNAALFGGEAPLHFFCDGVDGPCDEPVVAPVLERRGHTALISEWVRSIREGGQPAIQASQAAHVVQIIEGAYASAVTGCEVCLQS